MSGTPPQTAAASRLGLSRLAPHTFQSEIRAMTTACDRMGGINLAQGVCDTPVPAIVEEAAIEAMRNGQNIYTRCDGNDRLRAAIAQKQLRDYGLRYDADREVMVTSGATAGLHVAAMALLDPGDEVILFEPFYGYHVNTLKVLGAVPVIVPLAEPDWQLDTDALRAAITPRTRAILLNTPANPSGKIFSLPELEQVAAVCQRPRPLPHHRRDLRVLRLRWRGAHLPGHAARHARAHHCRLGIQQDLLGDRLAGRLLGGRRALDAGHGPLPRPHLRLLARAAAARRSCRAWSSCRPRFTSRWPPTIVRSASAWPPPSATQAWTRSSRPAPTTSLPAPTIFPARPHRKKPAT